MLIEPLQPSLSMSEHSHDQELSDKLQQRIVTNAVMEQVKQGNPDLNEPNVDASSFWILSQNLLLQLITPNSPNFFSVCFVIAEKIDSVKFHLLSP